MLADKMRVIQLLPNNQTTGRFITTFTTAHHWHFNL